MNRTHIFVAGLILLEILLLFLGCHGDNHDPLTPVPHPGMAESLTDDVPANIPASREVANTPSLWGLYRVTYDASSHQITTVPLRWPSLALNVVTWLQPPRGSAQNVAITVLDDSQFATTGRIDVRVMLHHPFPGQKQYTGFDVYGIFMTEGSIGSRYDSELTYANPALDPTLLNPDGYTRWMNPSEFLTGDIFGYEPGWWGTSESSENSGFVAGATLNPYKYFGQGLGPSDPVRDWLAAPDTYESRGIFPSGASCARDYDLRFPIVGNKMVFIFNYAVLANWAEPIVQPVTDPLTDFPPDANARWPLHVFVTDNSQVYYTADEAGGRLEFEIEVFDWDSQRNPAGTPGEVSRFVVWSDKPLVPGGYVEVLSTEVEWNSGFTCSVSVASIEIGGAVPEQDGELDVWIAVESSNPSSYDQGLGAEVPDDAIAAYVMLPVLVRSCPKAFLTEFELNKLGKNTQVDDLIIQGTDFVEGSELGVWLEQMEAGGSAGGNENYKIVGTDVRFIDGSTISADFDLSGAPVGVYGAGCVNGCGIVSYPDEQGPNKEGLKVMVVPESPWEIELSTGRDTASPAQVTSLHIYWNAIEDASFYKVWARCYDMFGSVVTTLMVGTTENTYYTLDLDTLPISDVGSVEVWITACTYINNVDYESYPSRSTYLYIQGFETGMGLWKLLSDTDTRLQFVRSNVTSSYGGYWGTRSFGTVPPTPSLWIVFASPPIPEVEGAGTIHFEFVHRHKGIVHSNGYQVGWCSVLPSNGDPEVAGYKPVTSTAYGHKYNDDFCTALQTEFGVGAEEDFNFQTDYTDYEGWYLSGFDVSGMIGDGVPGYALIGFAGDYYDYFELNIDDVALLIY